MKIADYGGYRGAAGPDDLLAGDRAILRFPPEPFRFDARMTVLSGNGGPLDPPRKSRIDLHLVAVPNALVFDRKLIVDAERGEILIDSFHRLRPSTARFDRNGLDPERPDWTEAAARAKRITGVTYHAGAAHNGYGHILLEGLSTCWGHGLVGEKIRRVLVGAGASAIESGLDILGIVPRRRVGSVPVLCDLLIVPRQAVILDRYISQRYWELVERIRAALVDTAARPGPPIYLSRRGVDKRRLVNEEEVEALFASLGFRIVRPEALAFADQVRAFAAAPVIAGPVGSAHFNAVFAQPGTRRLILAPENFYNRNDHLITDRLVHPPAYVMGRSFAETGPAAMTADWEIDIDTVRRIVPKTLAEWGHGDLR